jgi:acetylornithine deacetylase/succinyl-diaminopimelate desuccinylase-like protein
MNLPLHKEMPAALLDATEALAHASRQWDGDIVRQITDYIAIPAKSPGFDKDWAQHGYLETVLRNAAAWVEAQKVEGLTLEIVRLPGRTPVLFFEIAATRPAAGQTVLMYGHLDKQPEFNGWRSDLGPWTPKYEDGKLYGRGGADDGYAVYASIAAVQALKAQKVPHPRIVGLIETCEESGSYDLLPYVDALRTRLGDVGLVICLDSGAGNYDQLWLTTSLRGMASGTLKVQILDRGRALGRRVGAGAFELPHPAPGAGPAGGQQDRPPAAGQLPLRHPGRAPGAGARHGGDPGRRGLQALPLGPRRLRRLGVRRCPPPPTRCRPWSTAPGPRRCRSPAPRASRRCRTPATCCGRTPPSSCRCGCRRWSTRPSAVQELKALLEDNAPYQAVVTFEVERRRHRLERARHGAVVPSRRSIRRRSALRRAVRLHRPGRHDPADEHAEQGFPTSQMMVCGVLGPRSNAHGPNEFLHVPYAKRLTAAVAEVIARMP